MHRRSWALALGVVVLFGSATAPLASAANQPPLAVDDPASPGCSSASSFGGAFPIPEDYFNPSGGPGFESWFAFTGWCLPTANDSDPDGDPLTLELVGQPAHGQAIWLGAAPQMLAYKPDPNWSTPPGDVPGGSWFSDEIHYRVSDGTTWSNTASFRIWMAPVNDPPTFTPGSSLVQSETGSPAVSVPWATNVSAGPYEDDQHVSFQVDTDTRNAPGMFSVLPAIDADGVLTFTPGPDPGLATITVTAHDDGGLDEWISGSPWSAPPDDTADPVTFEIAVLPSETPTANDDELTLAEDSPAHVVDVLANDTDWNGSTWVDDLTVTGVSGGQLGSAQVHQGSVTYKPNADANGDDRFTYTVEDADGNEATGTVNVTITPVNDAPIATDDTFTTAHDAAAKSVPVLANDTDVDMDSLSVQSVGAAGHGTAALLAGTVSYRPDPGYAGPDSFDYTVVDGHGGSDTATVSVTVTANDPPIAVDDTLTIDEDTFGKVDVLANDSDPDGIGLEIVGTTDGMHGSVTVVNGGLRFTPDHDWNGADSFTYTIQDEDGATDTATVSVTVNPVNDAPVAGDDGFEVDEDASAAILDVLANDHDVDLDELEISAAGPAPHGTVALTDGGITYRPDSGFSGTDTFPYSIADGHGGTDSATVTVEVHADATPPVVRAGVIEIAGSTIGTSTVQLRYRWQATDTPSGVESQVVQRRLGTAAFQVVSRPAAAVSSIVTTTVPGRAETWRVQATDHRGNASPWVAWPSVTTKLLQERSPSIHWTGTWHGATNVADSGRATRYTTAKGARASLQVRARAIAWIGTRRPGGGRVEVWIDGVKRTVVDTNAPTTHHRVVLFQMAWGALGSHRIELRALGGGRVDLDAFVIVG